MATLRSSNNNKRNREEVNLYTNNGLTKDLNKIYFSAKLSTFHHRHISKGKVEEHPEVNASQNSTV